jgi:hypothetical protein
VTLPPDIIDRADAGAELREDERKLIAGVPEVTARLLANIPRLEPCARMIAASGETALPVGDDPISRGARILRLMADHAAMMAAGRSPVSAMTELHERGHPLAAIEALAALESEPVARHQAAVLVRDLRPGMTLDEDVRATNGVLLVARGQELTRALLERILNFHRLIGLAEPIRVNVT